ncbi:uncharacterized protein BDV17DRAFT_144006 [Aspergillus undulatus]|uniref:uncharacterized protein n=1 Tax=Aspergillus undulatus TaxID=1810928 RepID=UPI003CCD967E
MRANRNLAKAVSPQPQLAPGLEGWAKSRRCVNKSQSGAQQSDMFLRSKVMARNCRKAGEVFIGQTRVTQLGAWIGSRWKFHPSGASNEHANESEESRCVRQFLAVDPSNGRDRVRVQGRPPERLGRTITHDVFLTARTKRGIAFSLPYVIGMPKYEHFSRNQRISFVWLLSPNRSSTLATNG